MSAPNATPERLDLSVVLSFTKTCNFGCFFCYATYNDIDGKKLLLISEEDLFELVRQLGSRFSKVTFVGGEPTLYRRLHELLEIATNKGALTDVVTNGHLVDDEWISRHAPHLNFLTLSIDSAHDDTNLAIGRATRAGKVVNADRYVAIAESARKAGIGVKVNTVVNIHNNVEDLSALITQINPIRWKILEADFVEGQNDRFREQLRRDPEGFNAFIRRHRATMGSTTRIVEMPVDAIHESYVVVSPDGKFIDNSTGTYLYSDPILEVGIDRAREQVTFDHNKFLARDGAADFIDATPTSVVAASPITTVERR